MAEFGMPFDMPQNPDNPDYYMFSAAEERMRIGAEMTDGVFPEVRLITTNATAPEQVIGNSLLVKSGEGLNVILSKGIALCGSTFYFNTEEKIIEVSTGTNDIVVDLDLSAAKITVINQTRTDGNIEDSLIRTVSRWQIALATVIVPADAETIDYTMITDHRLNTTPCSTPDGRPVCGLVGSVMQLSSDMILDEWNFIKEKLWAEWEFIKDKLAEDPAGSLQAQIGNLDNLTTENKENLVSAVNESISDMGGLANLTTEDKTNLVNAVNEVVSKVGGEISGYPVSVENPKHNGLLYFDIRQGENGEFVISNSALPSSAEEFSYVGDTTQNSGSKTLTGTTQNGNLINQRYLSATISWTLQTKNSDDEWVTSSSAATKSLNSDGSVSFSGNDFKWVNGNNSGSYSSYFNSISVDANGNVTISLTMRGIQWRSLNLTISGVY